MPASRIVFLTLALIFAVVYFFRLYKTGNASNRSAVVKLVVFALLIPIPSIAPSLDPPLWLRPLVNFGPQYYGTVFCCLAINQIMYNKPHIPIIKNGLFPVVTILYIPLIILAYIEGEIPVGFTDNKLFPHTWSYYTLTLLDYFIVLYIAIYITYKLGMRLKQDVEPVLKTRYILAFIGTAAMMIGYAMVEINVLLFLIGNDVFLQTINNTYKNILTFASFPFFLSFLIPRRIIMVGIKFIKTETKSTQRQSHLHYLHQHLARITPEVILQKDTVYEEDLVTEIADLLLIIRSSRNQSFISARREAAMILTLTQNSQALTI